LDLAFTSEVVAVHNYVNWGSMSKCSIE
jgi:hypothetical protein